MSAECRIQNQINSASNYAIYAENQFDVTPTFTAVAGGLRQGSHTRCAA